MSRKTTRPLPALERLLKQLGDNIRLARLRRKFSAATVAARAGMARNTLRSVERGDPSVTMGAYLNVIFVLGLEEDFKKIASDDVLGRKLQDAQLPTKARAPKIRRIRV